MLLDLANENLAISMTTSSSLDIVTFFQKHPSALES